MRPKAAPPACSSDRVPSSRSRRGLDWLVFFVADIQTGFGPFVAVFLTGQKWTQVDIGFVLTVSGLVGLLGQVPFGAIVDAARSLRAIAAVTLVAIGASAFAFAAWPIFLWSWLHASSMPPQAACWVLQSRRSASALSVPTG